MTENHRFAMTTETSRRDLLAGSATATLGALAGCSSLGLDDEDSTDASRGPAESTARDWLYDPFAWGEIEDPRIWVEYRSPASLMSHADLLHSDVEWQGITSIPLSNLDRTDVDWTIRTRSKIMGSTPTVDVIGGSFDRQAAREATTILESDSADEGESLGRANGFDLIEYSEGGIRAYRANRTIRFGKASESEVREFLDAVDEGESWPTTEANSVGKIVDAVGFEDAAQLRVTDTVENTSLPTAITGVGYTVDGASTTVRRAWMDDTTEADAEALGEAIDALRDITTSTDGDIVTLTATMDTDRTNFTDVMFSRKEAPYE